MTPEELKEIRAQLKLTQLELAKTLGVHTRTIQQWEGGQRKISAPIVKLIEFILEKKDERI